MICKGPIYQQENNYIFHGLWAVNIHKAYSRERQTNLGHQMIEHTHLHTLIEEIGPHDFREVAYLFLIETEGAIERLSQTKTTDMRLKVLYFIRGCALNLGMRNFSAVCETLGNNLQADSANFSLEAFLTSYQKSREAFVNFYAECGFNPAELCIKNVGVEKISSTLIQQSV